MKKILLITALLGGAFNAQADRPSVHGMLLFGKENLYASHLPMFHAPHDYQVIFKLNLSSNTGTVVKLKELQSAGETLFTIEPELFDLTKIVDSTLKSFKATLYRGHFERGGSPLGEVQVNVEKLLHATKLNPVSNPQIDEHLVFGEKGEYFSVHLIEGKPNLDFIAQVAQPYKLSFLECRRRICPEPKKTQVLDSALPLKVAGEKSGNIPMEFKGGDVMGFGNITEVIKVIYSEREELSH